MFIPRQITPKVQALAKNFPVLAITGPRQSGKTTLVKRLFSDYTYISLENPFNREQAEQDPLALLTQHENGVIIDEAQYVPELFSHIQLMADNNKKKGEFIITGSQNFYLSESISQSLAGRVAILKLLPLSLRELQNSSKHFKTYQQHIYYGFYPRIFDDEISPNDLYPNYIETYVERDVRQILNVKNLSQFKLFLKTCAGHIGQTVNTTQISNAVGIDHKTVKEWISVLESSYVVFQLTPWYKNFNKRLVKSPKLYFYDTGLACSLIGINSSDQIDTYYAKGALFENFIIAEMMKNRFNKGEKAEFYFWKDNANHEVDVIVERGTEIHPIEIKSGQTLHSSFLKGLLYFNTLSENPVDNAHLIYGGLENKKAQGIKINSWKNLPF
ncbi:MAG: ATP-binding protein [Cyclobacteriaceae bacterium]